MAKVKMAPWSSVTPDEVEACRYAPGHRWVVLRVGDVVMHPYDPDELMVVCEGCFSPRCGHTTEENPCMLPRHHRELHLYADGSAEDASRWPGNEKPQPPDLPVLDQGEGRSA